MFESFYGVYGWYIDPYVFSLDLHVLDILKLSENASGGYMVET